MMIWLETTGGDRLPCQTVLSCEISAALDAACDSLSVWLHLDSAPPEIVRIRAEENDRLLFYGPVDRQTARWDESGFRCYFYARSEAAVLVDNEAEPMTLYCPGTDTVLALTAAPFGFRSRLEATALQTSFDITKGMSLYAVLSEFYRAAAGKEIWIDAGQCIRPAEPGKKITLAPEKILQACSVINRAEPISAVDYKSDGDTAYIRHCKSQTAEEAGIRRVRKYSLHGTPVWLRKNKAARLVQAAMNGYKEAQLTVAGAAQASLCDRVELHLPALGLTSEYTVKEICRRISKNTDVTELVLAQACDAKEIHYVDR